MDKERVDACYTSAAEKALASFPVEANNVKLVAHSENITFKVSASNNTDYVLRLHRPGYNSIEELNSERQWIVALKDAGLPVPDALLTSKGQHFVSIEIPEANEHRYVGMTTWLQGTPLSDYLETSSDSEERTRLFGRIGGLAAAIHNQSTDWKPPEGFVRHSLDVEGLLGDAPYWGRFWDHAELTPAEKSLLLEARKSTRAALFDYGANSDNFGLIHADIHPDNVVYDGKDLALIDFDDTAYGWHMYEIATALFESMVSADFDSLRSALLDGYREHRPLTDADLAILPTFLLVRGMAIIGWFHQRAEHVGSDYFEEIKNIVFEICLSDTP